jgi:hypothetical protein
MFNIIHRLRRCDPCFGNDIVNRRPHALCVVLGKQTQVFVSDLDVGPYTLIQHKKQKYRRATPGHKREPFANSCSGALLREATAGENRQRAVQSETLLRSGSSWDGEPYKSYPSGQPELSVLKITLAPHTELEWHSHPMPNAAYIVSGELTLERKKGKEAAFCSWTGRFRDR